MISFRHQVGPGYYERWTKWNSRTEEESKKAAILSELERLLLSDDDHRHSDPKLKKNIRKFSYFVFEKNEN
jgi:hypothetical protein